MRPRFGVNYTPSQGWFHHWLDFDVWGVAWWCSHDVARSLADFPELEYTLGLLTNDREVKPSGAAVARAVADLRDRGYAPRPRTTALVVDVGDSVTAPHRACCAAGGEVFEAWAALTAQGVRPALVLADRAEDAAHLTARGITEVVTAAEAR